LILIGALFLVGWRQSQCNHRNEDILTDLQPFNWRISSAQLKVKLIMMYLSDYHWHYWSIYTFIMLVYLSAYHWHCWSTMFDLHIHHVMYLSAYHWHCWLTMFDLHIHHVIYLSAYHWQYWSTMFDLHIHHVGVLVSWSLILLINHVWSTHSSCLYTCQLITDIVDQPCLIYTSIICNVHLYMSAYHWYCLSTMFDLHIHHVGVFVSLTLIFSLGSL